MKRLLIAASALTVLSGVAATAQAQPMERREHREAVREHRADVRQANRHDRRVARNYYYGGRRYAAVRGPRWVAPRGWKYRRYAVGVYVPNYFLGASYYVNPVSFGIRVGPAGAGRRWIRVHNDLYLVTARGRVVRVVPNVFY